MKSSRILFSSIIVGFLMFPLVSQSFALSKEYSVTLQGLKEVFVQASRCNDSGSTEDSMLKTRAELRLRQVGLRILSESNWSEANGKPQLYIFICKGFIEVALRQDVLLSRLPKLKTWIQTWRISSFGDPNDPKTEDIINRFLDEFINDFLSANNK